MNKPIRHGTNRRNVRSRFTRFSLALGRFPWPCCQCEGDLIIRQSSLPFHRTSNQRTFLDRRPKGLAEISVAPMAAGGAVVLSRSDNQGGKQWIRSIEDPRWRSGWQPL